MRRRAGTAARVATDTRVDDPMSPDPPGVAVSGAVTRDGDDTGDAIRLDDGSWVDAGPDGLWRPTVGERTRAAVILTVFFVFLFSLALVASVDDGDGDVEAAVRDTTTTTTEPTTTTTTEPPDPSSLDGEPASLRCRSDDRNALALRERRSSTVLVLNGTYRDGHAGATTEELEDLGYSSVVPDNADRHEETVVSYQPGFCAEAERLAEDLEIAGVVVEPVSPDLPVVVGRARLVVTLGLDSL